MNEDAVERCDEWGRVVRCHHAEGDYQQFAKGNQPRLQEDLRLFSANLCSIARTGALRGHVRSSTGGSKPAN